MCGDGRYSYDAAILNGKFDALFKQKNSSESPPLPGGAVGREWRARTSASVIRQFRCTKLVVILYSMYQERISRRRNPPCQTRIWRTENGGLRFANPRCEAPSYFASKNKKLWSVTVVPLAAVALMWQPRQPDGGVGPKAGSPGLAGGKKSAGRALTADAFVAASCT